MNQHVIYPYTGVGDSVGVPEFSCLHFAKLRCTPLVAGPVKVKHREGMDKAVSMSHSAMQLNCTPRNRSAWAKGMEYQGEEEICLTQWNSLLSFWETECSQQCLQWEEGR